MRLRKSYTGGSRVIRLRELLVLVEEPPRLPRGTVTVRHDLHVGVVSIAADGETVLPAFTSERALLEWRAEGGPFIGMDGRSFVDLALHHGFDRVVVDPGRPDCIEVSRAELNAFSQDN